MINKKSNPLVLFGVTINNLNELNAVLDKYLGPIDYVAPIMPAIPAMFSDPISAAILGVILFHPNMSNLYDDVRYHDHDCADWLNAVREQYGWLWVPEPIMPAHIDVASYYN